MQDALHFTATGVHSTQVGCLHEKGTCFKVPMLFCTVS